LYFRESDCPGNDNVSSDYLRVARLQPRLDQRQRVLVVTRDDVVDERRYFDADYMLPTVSMEL
jgi:hypothetical protein